MMREVINLLERKKTPLTSMQRLAIVSLGAITTLCGLLGFLALLASKRYITLAVAFVPLSLMALIGIAILRGAITSPSGTPKLEKAQPGG
jgi:hypothetical protein